MKTNVRLSEAYNPKKIKLKFNNRLKRPLESGGIRRVYRIRYKNQENKKGFFLIICLFSN